MSKLYIIPTPIGNLDDLTLRSLKVLNQADLILAEDTRTSKKLLQHFDIRTKVKSLHMHNEHLLTNKYIDLIKQGQIIALISDAGMPLISDPGSIFVKQCVKEGVEVDCLPGPTAFLPALVLSGLCTKKFVFEGFLPLKKRKSKSFKTTK